MKDLTKRKVLGAIKRLIKQYETGKHDATQKNCPLCQIYNSDNDCGKCPNTPFLSWGYPCCRRCNSYTYLSWNSSEHNLVKYWTDVHDLLKSKTSFEVTTLHPELWSQIIAIAEKNNHER